MSRQQVLTVALDEDAEEVAAIHRTILASLPDRWRITRGEADAAVVFGGRPDWPSRAETALAAGARGLLVTCPTWTDPTRVTALAVTGESVGARIAVETSYLADVAWKAVVPLLRAHAAEAVLIDSVRIASPGAVAMESGQGLVAQCVEQLAVLTTVVGSLPAVAFMQSSRGHYALRAESSDRIVNAVGVHGGRPGADRLNLEVIGVARSWRISFDSSAIARPTIVEMTDSSGVRALPANYEGGRRCAWLELYDAIIDAAPISYDLRLLGECLRLAAPMVDGMSTNGPS
jgi:hypothetical protein